MRPRQCYPGPGAVGGSGGSVSQVILQTERLVLRPFEADDVPAFHECMSDPEVACHNALPPITLEQAREMVGGMVASQGAASFTPASFAIALREGGPLIGNCRLKRDRIDPDQADIAYFLCRRFWERGYATEAARALIDYGFQALGLRRIFGLCVPENVASRRVMEKAGMRAEGPLTFYADQGNFWQGEFRDVTFLRYAIETAAKVEGKRK